MEPALRRKRPSLPLELAMFLAVCAFAGEFAFLHRTLNLVHPPAALERLCACTAETPYQFRVLVPTIVRAVEASGFAARLGITQLGCALWIEAACVVLFFYALRALLATFLEAAWKPAIWAAVGLYALPFLYIVPRAWPYWYPWDIPAVMFTTLGILWIRKERWSWYWWFFPLATLNRETTAFLVVIFALTQFGRLKWLTLLAQLAAQAAIWLAIKWLLGLTFKRNPGVGEYYKHALQDNWSLLQSASNWMTMALVFGGLWLPLLFFARHIRERFVRRALIVVPLYFAVSFVLAQFDELRIYGEMLPLVVLGLACGVEGWRAKRATAPSAP